MLLLSSLFFEKFKRAAQAQLRAGKKPPPDNALSRRFESIIAVATNIKNAIMDALRPHAWASGLHFAARANAAKISVLLIDRGALTGGVLLHPVCGRRTPMIEAMAYARKNMTVGGASAW